MDDLIKKIFESRGIKDFDDLKDFEKPEYFRLLEVAQSSAITLEDVKKSITVLREKIEFSLATEKLTHDEDLFLKARLKNYILIESLLNRPERAKDMLDQYTKLGVMK